MKNKTTAALLAFFFGGLGVHRFYLNQTGLGFLYLLLCWTLVPGIVALVDFIIFLTSTDEQFNEKYNADIAVAGIKDNAQVSATDKYSSLEKLHILKERGVITSDEFEAEKRKFL